MSIPDTGLIDQPEGQPEALSAQKAERIVNRLCELRERRTRIEANAAKLLADVAMQERRLHDEWDGPLAAFVATAAKRGTRIVRFLEGAVGLRHQPSRLIVTDPVAAEKWAAVHCPDAVEHRTKVRGDKIGVGRFVRIDEAGEERYATPPGFDVAPGREALYVKPTPHADPPVCPDWDVYTDDPEAGL